MHKGIICTYERNIYLSVRRIYGFTNGFLLIALANCESNEPYVNCIFSSTLTSFLSYLLPKFSTRGLMEAQFIRSAKVSNAYFRATILTLALLGILSLVSKIITYLC